MNQITKYRKLFDLNNYWTDWNRWNHCFRVKKTVHVFIYADEDNCDPVYNISKIFLKSNLVCTFSFYIFILSIVWSFYCLKFEVKAERNFPSGIIKWLEFKWVKLVWRASMFKMTWMTSLRKLSIFLNTHTGFVGYIWLFKSMGKRFHNPSGCGHVCLKT